MTEPILPPLKPTLMKDRVSIIFIEKGNLDVPRICGDEPWVVIRGKELRSLAD